MTRTTRRRLLLAGAASLAALAGCNDRTAPQPDESTNPSTSTTQPTTTPPETARQVPTTDDGVVVRVQNDTDAAREIRVTGVGDDQTATVAPGNQYDAGVLHAPENGEISYQVVVWVDGERAAERQVAVRPDGDLAVVVAHLQNGSVSWSETYSGPVRTDTTADAE